MTDFKERSTLVGYARVSTKTQNEDRQVLMLAEKGCIKTFIDKESGKDTNREEFHAMMAFVREGDTLVIESISRLSRSVTDFLKIMEKLKKKGVSIISIKESFDTTTPVGVFVMTMFAALAQMERERMLERQREGYEIAKAKGVKFGRNRKELPKNFGVYYDKWKAGKCKSKDLMEKFNLKPNTFYRRVEEFEAEREANGEQLK